MASPELSDMTQILDQAAQVTGVTVHLHPTDSLPGAQDVIDGKTNGIDAIWFASNNYLTLYPGALAKLDGTTEIMSSPAILALRTSVVHRLGWDPNRVTWAEIADAAGRHEFTFGMTDPAKSDAGLSALVGVATAVAGKGGALQPGQIPQAVPQLAGLFHAQVLKADSSEQLRKEYQNALTSRQATPTDGLIDYESELLALQAASPPGALTLIYPSDGTVAANYPLSVLASAPAAAKSAYQRLAAYLRTPPVQRTIMQDTHRRPIIGGITLTDGLEGHQPFELPFPAASRTILDLIDAYNGELRRASRTVYVLDTSGSMAGSRLAGLKRALLALTGADPSLAGQFSSFQAREQVTFLPFSTTPGTPKVFRIPSTSPMSTLLRIRSYTEGLTAGGWTAIYDSLVAAYQLVAVQHAADPSRIETIVLLTDGENNRGRDLADFIAYYHTLPPGSPPVYPIALGEARKSDLMELAAATGGKFFDAVSQPVSALLPIFERIRGYQ